MDIDLKKKEEKRGKPGKPDQTNPEINVQPYTAVICGGGATNTQSAAHPKPNNPHDTVLT